MLNLYVANLGKYNEGYLVGEWISLPFTIDEWDGLLNRIGIDGIEYEEVAIHDYECDIDGIEISEYSDIWELNKIAEKLDVLEEHDRKVVEALIELGEYTKLEQVLDNYDGFMLMDDVHTDYDLGYYWIVESGCYDTKGMGSLAHYIDYEAFGRDVRFDTDGGFTKHGWIERC